MTSESELASALPDYDIGGELGRGGFGLVLKGHHRHLNRDVAIKELPAALAQDPEVRRRFAAEARVLASLSHPHIVPIYDYVERDGHCLLVMELLPGGTVWSHFKAQGFTPETACAVVMATCAGLHYAHDRGVLHRDVKPENILFSADKLLKITDFGIAKVIGGSETLATKGGEILGTPAYMAPEQAGGPGLAATADVYATGVMLFELLSGQLPYSDEGGALAIVYRHVYEDPYRLDEVAPDVPEPFTDVTMRAIARAIDDRYPSAEAFGVALGEAAATAWGPDWLARAEMQIVDPGPISEAAKRPSRDHGPPPPSQGADGPPAGARRVRRSSPPPPPPPPPPPGGSAPASGPRAGPSSAGATRIRPRADEHAGGVAPGNLADAELVPVREVIELPSPPLVHALGAVVLLLLSATVALIGLGKPTPATTIPAGVVTVAGTDVASGEVVKLDLAHPIEVGVALLPAEATGADGVQLGFSVGGAPLPASTVGPIEQGDGVRRATVEASSARFLAGGELTSEVRLLMGDQTLVHSEFLARPTGSAFLTIPGAVTVVLLLFLLSYAEALLRPMRRGRRQISGIGGLVVVGAGLGVALVALGWLLGAPEPRVRTAIVCVLLGVGAGLAAAMAARRAGQRRRIKPKATAAKKAAA